MNISENRDNKQLALWLFVCAALIFTMIIVGGATRLTRSGLSMVEWAPMMGVIPPLTDTQWQQKFDEYKHYPEYKKINSDMQLPEFKKIFWYEYSHRLLGRFIGIVFLAPFIFFLIKGKIKRKLAPKLVVIFILGGLQGLLGWYMVKSGLINNPHVSQYRLAAHLISALLIYGYILWVALSLLYANSRETVYELKNSLKMLSYIITTVIVLMIISGGFVAGTKAGFAFNTFPLMNNQWLPEDIFSMQPVYINFFENIATIQFTHRIIALSLCLLIPVFWLLSQKIEMNDEAGMAINLLLLMLVVQVILGITTLIYIVPVPLAVTHQAGAIMLFSIAIYLNHRLRD